jgi:hypothetical protein
MAVLVATAAMLAACGGSKHDDQRADVNRYIEQENAVLRGAQHDFQALNEAYRKFTKGQLDAPKAIQDLSGAERTIRTARADVAKLQPPADARALHDKVLHYLDINVFLADETVKLASYMPASAAALKPLAQVNKSLQSGWPTRRRPGPRPRRSRASPARSTGCSASCAGSWSRRCCARRTPTRSRG